MTQRCAGLGRLADVLVQHILEARTGHGLILCIDEELRDANRAPDAQPGAEISRRFLPERQATFLAALTPDHHARAVLERQVLGQDADQLRDPQASGEAEVHHCPVAHAGSCGKIGGVEDRANFLHRQMADELLIVAFDRDRMDPADLLQGGGHLVFHITHERLDGGESQVARGSSVPSLLLDMG